MFNRTLLILSFICLISCSKEIIQQKLTVSVTPANGGSVSPPSNSYEKGSNVSLVATPTGEYLFKQWQGSISGTSNPASITMDADKSVTGVFEKRQYPLTLTIEGSGTVKEEVIGIAGQALYPSGTTVRLTAQPADKFEFAGWSGDITSSANPLDLKIDKTINLKALFQQIKFPGYKVQPFSKLDEPKYWRDCGVMLDVIGNKFFKRPDGKIGSNFLWQPIAGDYNKDGWVDIFNPGTGTFNGKMVENPQWLIWNPISKTYENKNLFKDKSITQFGGTPRKTISVDLNKDGYTDAIIFDIGDDMAPPGDPSYWQPIRLVLSNADGSYELKEINATPKYDYFHGGDIGDLNGDGIFDIVLACGSRIYVTMGIANYPYFDNKTTTLYDNTTGANNAINLTLLDVNKDGLPDMCLGAKENESEGLGNKIAINQGGGVFNKSNTFLLQYTKTKDFEINDFRTTDLNNDGLMDIIAVGDYEYDNWAIMAYIQKSKNVFEIDATRFVYTINTNGNRTNGYKKNWKPWLIHFDYNNDGIKDISYIDAANFFGELKTKSVFIKEGNDFIEKDFYQYDDFVKSLKP
jgi:hypothetical protein